MLFCCGPHQVGQTSRSERRTAVRPCSKPVLREGFSQIGYLHKHTAIMVGRGCDILTLAICTVLFSVILVTLFFAMIADYVIGSLRGRQVSAAGMARVPGLSHADFERSGDGRLRTARPLRRAVRMVRLTTSSVFFFKQKTAYELLRSDWSSDVCSSDLPALRAAAQPGVLPGCLGVDR